jgi:RNA polymerase sigma factor (sigma-70 family)
MKDRNPPAPADIPHRPDPAVRELVLSAQAGSREAYLTLLSKYRPLLESSVARFGASEMTDQERADMREEAERVFLSAVSTFDTEQEGVDLGLYAKICLRNGLVSEWRHMRSRRLVATVPLEDEITGRVTDPDTDPARQMMEDERFGQLCRTVRSHLSELENRVWWQYVTGVSVADIAEGLGRDERSVHNAIYRIRKKLREKLTPPEE